MESLLSTLLPRLVSEVVSSVEWAQRNGIEDDYSLSTELDSFAAEAARSRRTFGENTGDWTKTKVIISDRQKTNTFREVSINTVTHSEKHLYHMVYGETTSHVTAKGWGKTNSCLTFEEKWQMDVGEKAGRGKNPCFPNTRSLSTSAICLLLN